MGIPPQNMLLHVVGASGCKSNCLRPTWLTLAQLRRYLVVPALRVHNLLSCPANSSRIFGNDLLATVSGTRRGEVLASVVRSMMASSDVQDAENGTMVNGGSRGKHRTEYDWVANGRRVECKSSMLQWHIPKKGWRFTFLAVKLPLAGVRAAAVFDDLVLVLYTPRGVYIYSHDLQLGVCKHGKLTASRGHDVQLAVSAMASWVTALDIIISKLDSDSNNCHRIAFLPLSDPRFLQVLLSQQCFLSKDAFNDVPLADMSCSQRGFIIQEVVQAVDAMINPTAVIQPGTPGTCINGRSRTHRNSICDWERNGRRVECKSGMLAFVAQHNSWKMQFKAIKINQNVLDDLLLALYTPRGIYVYRHNLCFGISRTGKLLDTEGHQIQIYGKCGITDWSEALDTILEKLDSSGCQRL
ncbi:unnamed protein product, partial [Polarella glacialis]